MEQCNYCSEKIQDDAKKCKFCSEWLQKTDHQNKQTINQNNREPKKLEGFGGWLILLGLGMFATPILIFISLIYHLQTYNGLEILFNLTLILMYIWLNYLIVKRKKIFTKWFIGIGTAQLYITITNCTGSQ